MTARGTATIKVGEREVHILYTNRAILTAEKQLDRGIVQILQTFSEGGSYIDLVALLRVGMEAARVDARSGGRSISNDDALNVLDEIGFAAAIEPVMTALAAVLSYGTGDEEPDPNA
jgi:hypothetical protein